MQRAWGRTHRRVVRNKSGSGQTNRRDRPVAILERESHVTGQGDDTKLRSLVESVVQGDALSPKDRRLLRVRVH